MSLKATIVDLARSLGFQRTVVAALDPITDSVEHFQNWIDRDFAAGMNYLKRDVNGRHSPALLLPQARSAIIVSLNYYTKAPPAPGQFFGRVASYAVGLDYHSVLRAKLRDLKLAIEATIGQPLLAKAFSDDVHLNERGLAARHGLGFAGRNTLIIGPKLMGSYNFIGELFTDLPLTPDEKYIGTCGQCFRCGSKCPTNALLAEGTLNSNLCISYLTIENKEGIPVELRPKLGKWLFGCDICQEVCPYNQRPPETSCLEFKPEAGAGHYVNLLDLLTIQNEEDFLKRFQHTALKRPKRRGLLRNALVVLGNCLRELAAPPPFASPTVSNSVNYDLTNKEDLHPRQTVSAAHEVIRLINNFRERESDPMLLEHAAWACTQYTNKQT